jgi:hypothetical protein
MPDPKFQVLKSIGGAVAERLENHKNQEKVMSLYLSDRATKRYWAARI